MITKLRFLFDCERLQNILQYKDEDGKWVDVPTVYNYEDEGNEQDGNKE